MTTVQGTDALAARRTGHLPGIATSLDGASSWAMGVSSSRLDLSSYETAAQTLYEEGFGISLQMDNEQAAEEYLTDICQTINAVHFTDPSTGLWTLKLVRQDYDPATLPEFGPDDLQEDPEITWPSWPETINKVVVRYVSRSEGFTTRTVMDRDSGSLCGMDEAGGR